jgi:hypothetical protein
MRIQFMFCLDLLYRGLNDDYDYDYTPPPSSLVDEIQAQHQLSTTAGILSAPALQIRATRARMDNNATATGSNEVVERIRCR